MTTRSNQIIFVTAAVAALAFAFGGLLLAASAGCFDVETSAGLVCAPEPAMKLKIAGLLAIFLGSLSALVSAVVFARRS